MVNLDAKGYIYVASERAWTSHHVTLLSTVVRAATSANVCVFGCVYGALWKCQAVEELFIYEDFISAELFKLYCRNETRLQVKQYANMKSYLLNIKIFIKLIFLN